ncbi:hypothetical protein VP01_26g17 [Puccinia sorghi]|uniref:Uncharacterized protein n=1 Tax=Puccinia sorghi TaxID=27349 RepID=A0A0L6V5H9_9BASI|nr:hypothetical protein VP01_26g17 [Puccinia sorghi]
MAEEDGKVEAPGNASKKRNSSAWEFEQCAKGKNLRGLIAGYGIWWNIKYQSQYNAYKAIEVINSMLCDEYNKYWDQIAQ